MDYNAIRVQNWPQEDKLREWNVLTNRRINQSEVSTVKVINQNEEILLGNSGIQKAQLIIFWHKWTWH